MDFRSISRSETPLRCCRSGNKISINWGANSSIRFQTPPGNFRVKKHPFREVLTLEPTDMFENEFDAFVDDIVEKCAVSSSLDIFSGGISYETDEDVMFFDNKSLELIEYELVVGNEYILSTIVDVKGGYITKSGSWKLIFSIVQIVVHDCTYESVPRVFFNGISKMMFIDENDDGEKILAQ